MSFSVKSMVVVSVLLVVGNGTASDEYPGIPFSYYFREYTINKKCFTLSTLLLKTQYPEESAQLLYFFSPYHKISIVYITDVQL